MKEIAEILTRITVIEKKLEGIRQPFTFKQACAYLGFSEKHLYKLCYTNRIPCHNPSGRTLFFLKHELDDWIESKPVSRRHKK